MQGVPMRKVGIEESSMRKEGTEESSMHKEGTEESSMHKEGTEEQWTCLLGNKHSLGSYSSV